MLYVSDTPVFAKANSGIINKLFIGTNKHCNLSKVLFLQVYDFDGITIANIIPLIVE